MLCNDVPYELQQDQSALSDYIAMNSFATIDILLEKVLALCEELEENLLQELRASGSEENIPTLRLRAQAEVSLRVLSLCEARKKSIRSSSGSCSVLMRSRGLYDVSVDTPADSAVPYEFVVVRPSGMGVVVWAHSLGNSEINEIPNYAELPSSRLNFKNSDGITADSSNHARVVAVKLMTVAAQALDSVESHSFDASLLRFVGDVVCVDKSNSGNCAFLVWQYFQ